MPLLTRMVSVEDEKALQEASLLLQKGQVVAFPTETVYGLGANALDENAVRRIFKAKGRPADNPLIVHVATWQDVAPLVKEIPEKAMLLAQAFWPGPLTLIFKKQNIVPSVTTAGLDTVAVRIPAHQGAQALLRACGLPVAAPSANRSGGPSPTCAQDVWEDMRGRIPMILDGGRAKVGLESTVVDASGDKPVILRPGAVTAEMIRGIVGEIKVHEAVLRRLVEGETAVSPGMKHRHYAPQATVILVRGETQENMNKKICFLYDNLLQKGDKPVILATKENVLQFASRAHYVWGSAQNMDTLAHNLFFALRELDRKGFSHILCQEIGQAQLGLAVMNRLLRAANFTWMDSK